MIDSTRWRPQLLRDHERFFLTIESLIYAGRVQQLQRNGPDHFRRQTLAAAEPFRSELQLGLSACFRNFVATAGRDDQLGRNALADGSRKEMRR